MEHLPNYDDWKTAPPNDPKPVAQCDICGCDLYEGDYLTDFAGEKWCDECLKEIRRVL